MKKILYELWISIKHCLFTKCKFNNIYYVGVPTTKIECETCKKIIYESNKTDN